MINCTQPTFEDLRSKEWLITNGIGGYASGTLSGANSRRYHGMLIASLNPPTNRKVLVGKVEESIALRRDHQVELSANQYPNAVHPKGYQYLTEFEQNPLPTFRYEINGHILQKSIFMVYGKNATIIEYKNLGTQSIPLAMTPFLVDRDYHGLFHEGRVFDFYYEKIGDILKIHSRYGAPPLYIKQERGKFEENRYWIKNLEYEGEKYRGLDYHEDANVIGKFHNLLAPGKSCFLVMTTDANILESNPADLKKSTLSRLNKLNPKGNKAAFLKDLSIAADQFIVKRASTDSFSILAGYHWFTDWGRDTMIALRGLSIATGRKKESQSILKTFFDNIDRGMLPNRFPDYDHDEVEYNTVDATLWLFVALYEYYQKFQDKTFIKQNFKHLTDILSHHFAGTRYSIHVTAEGFLWAGEAGVQLTWMDAKVDGFVVTPREGCAVEIQALWYNALKIYQFFQAELALKCPDEILTKSKTISTQIKKHFSPAFYNENGYLNDVIIPNKSVDNAIRPNQIFVLSLPFDLLNKNQQKKVFKNVKDYLFTPLGLRSLNVENPQFKPIYEGDQWHRDTAYHQGTVWSWLLGDYWLAYLKLNNHSDKAKATVLNEMNALKHHFYQDNCINGISEIFDGAHPEAGRGTVQQAWSVGALIMVLNLL
ncbi:MAG: amylo-alpha-1,6-glucosidase [Saprospiraceae bacterium]